MICSIPDCGRRHYARSWCELHYNRWRKHGDPLTCLKKISPKGEPARFFREVVLAYEGDDCLPWPYSKGKNGYGSLEYEGCQHLVTRLVCEHVHGPAPTPDHEAAHSCGKGHEACCTKRHLSWKTHADNMADTLIHGTHNRGERNGQSKLTDADVLQIRALIGRLSQREIAEQFGVNRQTIGKIKLGRRWAWLEGEAA